MEANINSLTVILIGSIFVFIIFLLKNLIIVPQKSAYIIEKFGKYHATFEAGFHVLIPLMDRIAYRHSLKEIALDVPPQTCITKDNIAVEVDGILYLQVVDPKMASYGIDNYLFAATQLAQTTMRSIIGKLELDKTFEEREAINSAIVSAVDAASISWGVKVTRYEVKNITPPPSIRDAMEKQMRAEREKRAVIAESEGMKQAKINQADGEKQALIARSEGEKQRKLNEADGRAGEIERVAKATANGIREIAAAIQQEGGLSAVNLRVAEQYLSEFGKLAASNNSMIIPTNVADVAGIVGTAMSVMKNVNASTPVKTEPVSKK